MVLTPSTMLELGTPLPAFALTDVTSLQTFQSSQLLGPHGILVMFICRHCPYVKHINAELARLGQEYPPQGIGMVAIAANNPAKYPEDAPEKLAQQAAENGFLFPYLFDETQEVAKKFTAACTPDFFLFDRNAQLVYRGQLDDSRPGSGKPVTGADLRAALNAVIAGTLVSSNQKPAIGCNIKWVAGNEPPYFPA